MDDERFEVVEEHCVTDSEGNVECFRSVIHHLGKPPGSTAIEVIEAMAVDKRCESPVPVEGEWEHLKDRVLKVKHEVEESLEKTFDVFDAVKFIKRDFNYIFRVRIGEGMYIDLQLRHDTLFDVKELIDDVDAPLAFD